MKKKNLFSILDLVMEKFETFTLSFGVILLAALTIGNAFGRVVLNHSWTWIEEISQFIVILVTFLGIGYAARHARHIRMTAFYDMCKPKIRKTLIIIISTITALLLLYFTYLAYRYAFDIFEKGSVTPNLRIPRGLIMMWIPLGFFVGSIHYTLTVWKNFKEKDDVWVSVMHTDDYDPEEVLYTNIDT